MSVSRAAITGQSPSHLEPRSIRLETEHYVVRTLELSDVTERACAWFADPSKTATINLPARALSAEEFADYIASHDRVTGHALGIFDKATGLHIGLWAVYVDWDQSEFLINVLVGERGYEHGVRRETQRKITDQFFEGMGLETMRCAVLARNERLDGRFSQAGWVPEHTTYKPSVNGEAFEEVRHYSLTRERWRANYRASRELRDLSDALIHNALAGI
ncbi:MAG: GNAT family N-acetyltransferase [Alphaproteobacteria bacterium]|nr:GNAT family N-acetyltransferase [Alphaproteobacteria bacterium]